MKEVLNLCDKRQELRGKKHSSDEAWMQYQNVHREVRKNLQAAKEEWIEEHCNAIEKGIKSGDGWPTVPSNPSLGLANQEYLSYLTKIGCKF